MAINLAEKYEGKLAIPYAQASIVKGKTNEEYSWNGVKSINILSPVLQDLNDYDRTAAGNRYGTPTELQDTKQKLDITQDKAFSITIDRGNDSEQMFAKKSGEVSRAEIAEKVVPFFDKYDLSAWETGAGGTLTVGTLDKDTVLTTFIEARKYFVNHAFPLTGDKNYAYVTASTYALLLQNPNFITVEKLGEKVLTNGVVGKCMGFLCVETPDDYLEGPALFVHKKSVTAPEKLTELFIRKDVQGISGAVIEGRYIGDAHVIEAFKHGVVKCA